jgi:hypothetical protein
VTISNQANAVPGGYLSPNAAAFKRIFLYHSTAETGLEGRATTALFFLDGLNDLDPNEPPKLDENGLQIIPAARVAIWFTNPVCTCSASLEQLFKFFQGSVRVCGNRCKQTFLYLAIF